jgi:LIM-domain binding protein
LDEPGGGVLPDISDPQTHTVEGQPKGGGKSIWSVLVCLEFLWFLLTSTAEVGTPVLPRFFLVTSQSGVKSMTLSLDGARERVIGPNHAVVQCVSAMWTYRYHNGYTVTLRGPFTAHVFAYPNATQNGAPAQSAPHSTFILKIDHIQFDSNLYEKHVSVDMIVGNRIDANKTPQARNAPTPSPTVNGAGVPPPAPPQPQPPPPQASQRDDERWEEPRISYERALIPAEPVNAFGIPQATMRCLEVRSPNLGFPGASSKNPHGPLVGGECRTDD